MREASPEAPFPSSLQSRSIYHRWESVSLSVCALEYELHGQRPRLSSQCQAQQRFSSEEGVCFGSGCRLTLFSLPALLTRTFTDHVMLFTQTKKQAHRMHILLGLMGLQVGELHGNLSQTQRLEALR